MKRVFIILGFIGFGLLLFTFLGASPPPQEVVTNTLNHQGVYGNNFFEPRSFSYDEGQETITEKMGIWGAVVPHHLLAYKLIESVFSKIVLDEPDVLILIGPNHFNQGARVLTTAWSWQTPFGIVESDQNIIKELVEAQVVEINEEVFETEHSIGNLMPFVKFYLPDTQVVPIILHHDVSRHEAGKLGKYLAELFKERDCLIMASVDFSHYLTREEAERKDQETIQILRDKNMGKIFSLGNDHLDSPASLGVLFSTMEELGKEKFSILDNTNSGVILNNDLIETTSYLTLIFASGD